MTNFKKYKIIAFVALIIELIISFILFAKIRNLISNNNIESKESFFIILIFILLIITGLFFILVLKLTSVSNTQDINKDIKFSEISEDDEKSTVENESSTVEIENILKKISPKETPKFDITDYTEQLLSNFAKEFDIVQGLFYLKENSTELYKNVGRYAYFGEDEPVEFKHGETLSGQVAKNQTILFLDEIPENYVTILSGLGTSSPKNLLIIPIIHNNETLGIIELASFKEFDKKFKDFYTQLAKNVGEIISKH